jgi:predicted DNA-binding transcriptional regulator YafY
MTPEMQAATDDEDDAPLPPPPVRGDSRLQRWVDLITTLLVRSQAASFEELAPEVPDYWVKLREAEAEADPAARERRMQSLKRAFERDKEELRAFGILIESVEDEEGNPGGAYRLRRNDFYLPYLSIALPGKPAGVARRVDRYGYRALRALAFEPDELQAVVDAAACVRALGDPVLAAEASSALCKLAVDLPVDAAAANPAEPRVVLPRTRADAAVFDALSDALVRRKRVSFSYRAMSDGQAQQRDVEPWGLFFTSGHWYLAARDRERDALRNFRLSRITGATVNRQRERSPDYEIPAEFRLREHAQSRHAWELGDGEASTVVVEFRGSSGPAAAAAKLGSEAPGAPGRRSFQVRRPDAFVRWIVSFAGEAVPVEPPELVQAYERELRRTAEVYATPSGSMPTPGAAHAEALDAGPDATTPPRSAGRRRTAAKPDAGTESWHPRGAAAQLRRILHVVPRIADGEEHGLGEIAQRIGTDVDTLRRDLYSLVTRFEEPPGFVEGMQLYIESDRVSARSNHLLRPMRLTVSELCALELGLAVLRGHRTPEEHALLDGARERLRQVAAKLPADPIPDGLRGASLGDTGGTQRLAAVRAALAGGRELRITYRKSGQDEGEARTVCPRALVAANGCFYLVAYRGSSEEGVRVFRMDRVEDAEVLETMAEPAPEFSLDAVLADGRVFHHPAAATMRVRYSPRIARWIAEREGKPLDVDGALELVRPLADEEWALRHLLQYGPDAEVLEPEAMRELMRERIARMLAQAAG